MFYPGYIIVKGLSKGCLFGNTIAVTEATTFSVVFLALFAISSLKMSLANYYHYYRYYYNYGSTIRSFVE